MFFNRPQVMLQKHAGGQNIHTLLCGKVPGTAWLLASAFMQHSFCKTKAGWVIPVAACQIGTGSGAGTRTRRPGICEFSIWLQHLLLCQPSNVVSGAVGRRAAVRTWLVMTAYTRDTHAAGV